MSAPELPKMFGEDRVSPYSLAADAECASPDTPTSPGAEWLVTVGHSALEAWTWAVEHGELDELREESVHDLADGLIPVYTHNRWQVFTDLAAWTEDADDVGGYPHDLTDAAGVALYIIAERLISALFEEWGEELDDSEEE